MRGLVLLLFCLIASINGQSYIPRPVPASQCTSGTFVSYGNDDVQSTTTKTATTSMAGNTLVANLFNVTQTSFTITQLSFGILENLQISTVVNVRLGLYSVAGTAYTYLGQTGEIQLFATGSTIIYGDLQQPVTVQAGTYAVTIWSDALIYTGANAALPTTGASSTYQRFGYPLTFTGSSNQAQRAVKMVGCASNDDPWVGAGVQYYSFCLSLLHSEAAASISTSTSVASSVQVTVSGVIAVSTSNSGQNDQGLYYNVVAAKGQIQNIVLPSTAGAAVPGAIKQLTSSGGTFLRSYNQRFYVGSDPAVDANGISLAANDGTQVILQFQAGIYEVMVVSPGYTETFRAVTASFTRQEATRDSPYPTCSPARLNYTPQPFSCPAGTSVVSWGNDDVGDAAVSLNSTSSSIIANAFYAYPFTAHVPDTTLYSLSLLVNAQPFGRLQRLRMGLFAQSGPARLALNLIAQTQEIVLGGLAAPTTLRANLLQPVRLEVGRNYSIGLIADSLVYAPYNSFPNGVGFNGLSTYQAVAPSKRGFPSAFEANSPAGNQYFAAAYGCTTQPLATYSFCAAFVYPASTTTYSGVLTLTSNTLTDSNGRYRAVVSGFGTVTQTFVSTTTPSTSFPFTVHDWNLDSNSHLYEAASVNGLLLDVFGLQLSVQSTGSSYATSIRAEYDLLSDSYVYKEIQSILWGLSTQGLNPLVSSFTAAPYTNSPGSNSPTCGGPPRPANVVTPASVARSTCPNPDTDIADTFGDVDGGNYAVHADGTLIQPSIVYTQQFTADAETVVRQLAVGILQNADRPEPVRVRLGLYRVSDNTLLGQGPELTVNQAVPQVIAVNLPTPITLTSGQSYLVAIITSASFEVAHTGVPSSPSMAFAYDSNGLPSTFASSGNAFSPAIAAYACVRATHSFCAYYQYYTGEPGDKASVSYFYNGLIQAGASTTTNAYGTYLPVYAAAGKLIAYTRRDVSVTQAVQVYSFWQLHNTVANVYTSSTNGKALDGNGIILQTSHGAPSNLQFNVSINQYDESFAGAITVYERDLIFSGFTFTPISQAIPACGLSSLPVMQEQNVPLPVCANGEEVATYGDANAFSIVGNNNQGSAGMPSNSISLRQITTDGLQWVKLEQLKIVVNTNLNTFNRIRLGVYDAAFNFVGGSSDIIQTNNNAMMITAVLKTPVYLEPGSIYYLAFWSSGNVYVGFNSGSIQLMRAVLIDENTPWPSKFTQTATNAPRSIGAIGCFVDSPPPSTPSSSTGSGGPSGSVESTSNSGVEKGAVAGIVVGCVIGTNILLLALLWFCCMKDSVKVNKASRMEDSRVDNSRVEMEAV